MAEYNIADYIEGVFDPSDDEDLQFQSEVIKYGMQFNLQDDERGFTWLQWNQKQISEYGKDNLYLHKELTRKFGTDILMLKDDWDVTKTPKIEEIVYTNELQRAETLFGIDLNQAAGQLKDKQKELENRIEELSTNLNGLPDEYMSDSDNMQNLLEIVKFSENSEYEQEISDKMLKLDNALSEIKQYNQAIKEQKDSFSTMTREAIQAGIIDNKDQFLDPWEFDKIAELYFTENKDTYIKNDNDEWQHVALPELNMEGLEKAYQEYLAADPNRWKNRIALYEREYEDSRKTLTGLRNELIEVLTDDEQLRNFSALYDLELGPTKGDVPKNMRSLLQAIELGTVNPEHMFYFLNESPAVYRELKKIPLFQSAQMSFLNGQAIENERLKNPVMKQNEFETYIEEIESLDPATDQKQAFDIFKKNVSKMITEDDIDTYKDVIFKHFDKDLEKELYNYMFPPKDSEAMVKLINAGSLQYLSRYPKVSNTYGEDPTHWDLFDIYNDLSGVSPANASGTGYKDNIPHVGLVTPMQRTPGIGMTGTWGSLPRPDYNLATAFTSSGGWNDGQSWWKSDKTSVLNNTHYDTFYKHLRILAVEEHDKMEDGIEGLLFETRLSLSDGIVSVLTSKNKYPDVELYNFIMTNPSFAHVKDDIINAAKAEAQKAVLQEWQEIIDDPKHPRRNEFLWLINYGLENTEDLDAAKDVIIPEVRQVLSKKPSI